ncbi:hypothetical protein AB2908_25065, partial [Escherichia coli]
MGYNQHHPSVDIPEQTFLKIDEYVGAAAELAQHYGVPVFGNLQTETVINRDGQEEKQVSFN